MRVIICIFHILIKSFCYKAKTNNGLIPVKGNVWVAKPVIAPLGLYQIVTLSKIVGYSWNYSEPLLQAIIKPFFKKELQHMFRTHFKDDCLKLAIECHKLEPKTHVWLAFVSS